MSEKVPIYEIANNEFHFHGKDDPIKKIEEMIKHLKECSDEEYNQHVNDNKNDIAHWVTTQFNVNPEFKKRIEGTRKKEDLINSLNDGLSNLQFPVVNAKPNEIIKLDGQETKPQPTPPTPGPSPKPGPQPGPTPGPTPSPTPQQESKDFTAVWWLFDSETDFYDARDNKTNPKDLIKGKQLTDYIYTKPNKFFDKKTDVDITKGVIALGACSKDDPKTWKWDNEIDVKKDFNEEFKLKLEQLYNDLKLHYNQSARFFKYMNSRMKDESNKTITETDWKAIIDFVVKLNNLEIKINKLFRELSNIDIQIKNKVGYVNPELMEYFVKLAISRSNHIIKFYNKFYTELYKYLHLCDIEDRNSLNKILLTAYFQQKSTKKSTIGLFCTLVEPKDDAEEMILVLKNILPECDHYSIDKKIIIELIKKLEAIEPLENIKIQGKKEKDKKEEEKEENSEDKDHDYVTFKIKDKDTGRELTKGKIIIHNMTNPNKPISEPEITFADRFSLINLPAGDYMFHAAAEGYVPGLCIDNEGKEIIKVTPGSKKIELKANIEATKVTGILYEANKTPYVNIIDVLEKRRQLIGTIKVECFDSKGNMIQYDYKGIDKDGKFIIKKIPIGIDFRIKAKAFGFISTDNGKVLNLNSTKGYLNRINIGMIPDTTVTGRITDTAGNRLMSKPTIKVYRIVSGVSMPNQWEEQPCNIEINNNKINQKGEFKITGLPYNTGLYINPSAEFYRPYKAPSENEKDIFELTIDEPNKDNVHLKLENKSEISGKITDNNNRPIPNLHVQVIDKDKIYDEQTIKEGGRFRFSGLPVMTDLFIRVWSEEKHDPSVDGKPYGQNTKKDIESMPPKYAQMDYEPFKLSKLSGFKINNLNYRLPYYKDYVFKIDEVKTPISLNGSIYVPIEGSGFSSTIQAQIINNSTHGRKTVGFASREGNYGLVKIPETDAPKHETTRIFLMDSRRDEELAEFDMPMPVIDGSKNPVKTNNYLLSYGLGSNEHMPVLNIIVNYPKEPRDTMFFGQNVQITGSGLRCIRKATLRQGTREIDLPTRITNDNKGYITLPQGERKGEYTITYYGSSNTDGAIIDTKINFDSYKAVEFESISEQLHTKIDNTDYLVIKSKAHNFKNIAMILKNEKITTSYNFATVKYLEEVRLVLIESSLIRKENISSIRVLNEYGWSNKLEIDKTALDKEIITLEEIKNNDIRNHKKGYVNLFLRLINPDSPDKKALKKLSKDIQSFLSIYNSYLRFTSDLVKVGYEFDIELTSTLEGGKIFRMGHLIEGIKEAFKKKKSISQSDKKIIHFIERLKDTDKFLPTLREHFNLIKETTPTDIKIIDKLIQEINIKTINNKGLLTEETKTKLSPLYQRLTAINQPAISNKLIFDFNIIHGLLIELEEINKKDIKGKEQVETEETQIHNKIKELIRQLSDDSSLKIVHEFYVDLKDLTEKVIQSIE